MAIMERIAIVAAARTPIGKFMGGLSALTAVELGTAAVKAVLARARVQATDVEEVIMGQGQPELTYESKKGTAKSA